MTQEQRDTEQSSIVAPDDGAAGSGHTPFAVMAKPVGARCNMRCDYCYYLKTATPDTGSGSGSGSDGSGSDSASDGSGTGSASGGRRMSDETLARYVRQYIEASQGPEISFVWHGGEPSLAGIDFFQQAVDLQKQYLPEGWTCRNNLQTNGVLLDDQWCAFLASADFDVGLSIDGAQWIHDLHRKDLGGQGTYRQAAAAVHRLRQAGIQPDLLCTVTFDTAAAPLAVYRGLRDLGTGWIQFIPIVRQAPGGGVTADSVTGEGYGDFLCAVFDEWALHDLGRIDVQLFAEAGRVWAGGGAGLCWMAPTCGKVLIVEQDGGVYACDHFVTPQHRIGDIYASSLQVLADSPAQRAFGLAKQDTLPQPCHACPWLAVCHGGCPKDRFVRDPADGLPTNHLCAGLKRFFAYAAPTLRYILGRDREGASPDTMMAELLAQARIRWKGIGRNDPCPCGSGRKAKNCCWDRRP